MPGLYSDDERRARYEQWVVDEAVARMDRWLARRPAAFAVPGELNPELAAWGRRFLDGNAGNAKIVGNIGAGKTWNLWRLGVSLIEAGFLGRFEIVPAHRLKRLIVPPVDTRALDDLAEADLVALDDVAAIRVSDWDADHLYGLFDDRSSEVRPLIVASNMPTLRDVIGGRAASRLGHNLTTIKITGPDLRSAA